MHIHYLQHVAFEGPGCIETWVREKGHTLSVTRLYLNEPLPQVSTFDALVVMGGPMSAYDEAIYDWMKAEKVFIREAINNAKKVIGICLGSQLIAEVLGARVYPNKEKEIGWFPLTLTNAGKENTCTDFLPSEFTVFHFHGDTFDLPEGAKLLASSEACVNQAYLYKNNVLGLQFHIEATQSGAEAMLEHCAGELVEAKYIQQADEIKSQMDKYVPENNVYMFELLNRFLQ